MSLEIRAADLTGPGFASVLAKAEALKAAMRGIGNLGLDVRNLDGTLSAVKAKLQAHGIADLLDVNLNQGQISAQLQMLHRKIADAKISDLLDVNLNAAVVHQQAARLAEDVASIHVPLTITPEVTGGLNLAGLPVLGMTERIRVGMSAEDLAAARQGLAIISNLAALTAARNAELAASAERAAAAAGSYAAAAGVVAGAQKKANDQAAAGVPLWGLTIGRFGMLRGQVKLFGGALAGVPFVSAIGGAHLLIDSVLELAAVVIPASVAFLAFGAAAAPTVQDIYKRMVNLNTVTTAFGNEQYPMTGGFARMADAVKPQVYQMFGQALTVMNSKAGEFTSLAVGAGKALDQLGARAAAALVSGGFSEFMKNGPRDLAIIGDIIGNLFGTIGNLLHTMPGYAQILLGVLDGVSKALEAVTASPITQWLLGLGLQLHGFIVWGGLAVTATVMLGNAILGLAAKMGIGSGAIALFDTAGFVTAVGEMGIIAEGTAVNVLSLAGAFGTMAAAGDMAMVAEEGMAVAGAAMSAVNPLVWIGLAAAALGGLVYWLNSASASTVKYSAEVKTAFQSTPVSEFSIGLTSQQAVLTAQLAQATLKLGQTQEYATATNLHTGVQTQVVTQAYRDQQGVIAGIQGGLAALSQGQSNYITLLKAAGGSQAILNMAGLTSAQILSDQGSALAQDVIQVRAAANSWAAMSLGIGQNSAAMNAMNNTFMNETLPALQKVTAAEDAIITTILGGKQAFISFQQGMGTIATDAKVAGANIGWLNAQSLTLANDFYTTSVPAMQKVIDALQQQGTSTADLTRAVATGTGELLRFAGNNETARAVIVAMINDALGPGTVSLKTLDKWIGNNSTSLTGFNALIDKAAIKAGTLANILQNQLTAQFQADLLASSGATGEIKKFTDAITHQGVNSDAYRTARQQLINDLIKTGMTANDAKAFVAGLQAKIDAMHGKTVGVSVTASGSGTVTAKIQAALLTKLERLSLYAAGGKIPGFGGGDVWPALLEGGEAVVDKDTTRKHAGTLKAWGVPGFASGGVVGNLSALPGWAANAAGEFDMAVNQDFLNLTNQDFAGVANQVLLQLEQQAAASGGFAGPGGGAPGANAALARRLYPGMSAAQWNAWNYVSMRECLPLRTKILTRRGWLTHDEVRVGDETIGYNQRAGRSEWTKVTRVVRYEQAGTMRFGNAYWSAECTPEHRWLTERMFVDSRSRAESVRDERLLELRHRERLDRVILARVADLGGSLPITLNEAALLGWVAGDGNVWEPKRYVRRARPVQSGPSDGAPFGYRLDGEPKKNRSGRPRSAQPGHTCTVLRLTIVQSKPEHFAAIDHACSDAPRVGKVTARTRWRDLHFWNLGTDYSKDLLARAGHPKRDAVAQVLAMSSAQRAAWLDAITCAEGTTDGGKTVIYQNDGPVADAIELAIYLSGHRPSRTKDTRGEARNWAIRSTAPTIGGPNRNSFVRDAGYQDVWCVTTESGSWTAEQDGQIFLTGNSGWNNYALNPSSGAYGIPQALPFTKMPKAAWPSWAGGSSNPTAQETWMWGYMASRYGGPIGAAAHEAAYNWYDSGGWLPPGLSMAYNGTGQPERVSPPGGGAVTLEVTGGAQSAFDQFLLKWIREHVRVKGGGSVQSAFGRHSN